MAGTTLTLRALAGLTAAALIQGCSGGGGMNGGPPAAQAPRISGPSAVAFDQDTTGPDQIFRIEDSDTPAAQLVLSVTTSDPLLLPLPGVVVEGTGNARTLRITPAPETTGAAILTLTARDPGGLTSTVTLAVRVNPVPVAFSAVAAAAFGAASDAAPARVSGVTVQADVDDDPRAFEALLQQGAQ